MVTPCVGVWIETSTESESDPSPLSHPAWVCGLKLPHKTTNLRRYSHTLRGCVD